MLYDSLNNERLYRQTLELQTRYEVSQKEKEIQLLTKEKDVQQLLLERNNILMYTFIFGILFLLVFALWMYRAYRQKHALASKLDAQKREIELKNLHITDSLRYAERIQKAILPKKEAFMNVFPESFIIYMPKDIVSGDFYWLHANEGKVIFSAIDCTGHGVPGAFTSIVGHNLLNQAVTQHNLRTPGEIIGFLNNGIAETFGKIDDDHNVKAGMDLFLASVESETLQLEYSGAVNSAYILRGEEIIQLKSEKHMLGHQFTQEFPGYSTQTFQLQKNDSVYLFSDGYVDQMGGANRKRFLSRRFRDKLIDIRELPMQSQREALLNTFFEWKGRTEQTDDILVIGIRI
jgi:serine phosphatase RsbU (regulator of sigma subunit)